MRPLPRLRSASWAVAASHEQLREGPTQPSEADGDQTEENSKWTVGQLHAIEDDQREAADDQDYRDGRAPIQALHADQQSTDQYKQRPGALENGVKRDGEVHKGPVAEAYVHGGRKSQRHDIPQEGS